MQINRTVQYLMLLFLALQLCGGLVFAQEKEPKEIGGLSPTSYVYLTGNALTCDWTNSTPEEMTHVNGAYVWEGYLRAYGEFKFLTKTRTWNLCYNSVGKTQVATSGSTYSIAYNPFGGNDYMFSVNKFGKYRVELNVDSMTMKLVQLQEQRKPKRVFCVGNSITEGWGLNTRYPKTLGDLLGDDYLVFNMGLGGRAMLKNGIEPYWNEIEYTSVKESQPDIVVVKLGTNDSSPANWGNHKNGFKRDLLDMIRELSSLPSKPKIYLATPCYVTPYTWEKDRLEDKNTSDRTIRGTVIRDYIAPIIREVAVEKGLELIEFYEFTNGRTYLYSDGVHPTDAGAVQMAEYASKVILKKPVIIGVQNKEFLPILKGVTSKDVVKIVGQNLKGDLKVSVTGNGFAVSNTSISKAQAEKAGGFDLAVTCTPTSANATMTGEIRISSEGADTHVIKLSATPRDLYLIGSATPYQWNLANAGKMEFVDGCFTWSGILNPGELKMMTSLNSWFNCYYSTTSSKQIVADGRQIHDVRFIQDTDFVNGSNRGYNLDYKFNISESGSYVIKLDPKTNTITFKKELSIDTIWAAGVATDGKAIQLAVDPSSTTENKVFTYSGFLKQGELKFMTTATANASTYFIAPAQANADIESKAGIQLTKQSLGWKVSQANVWYNIKVTLSKVEVERVATKNALYLIGGATDAGWNNVNNAIPLVRNANNPYVFTVDCVLKVNNVNEGNRFKILGQFGWFGNSLHPLSQDNILTGIATSYKESVAPANPDYKWAVDPSKQGQYRVTVNTLEKTIKAEYLGVALPPVKEALYLVGGATDALWSDANAIPLVRNASDPYTFTVECTLKVNNVNEGNRFKILCQRSWFGNSLHPLSADGVLTSSFASYKESAAPASPDNKWAIDPSKQGRYKITVNTRNKTIKSEYLGLPKSLMTSKLETLVKIYTADGQVHISLSEEIKNVNSQLILLSNGNVLDSSSASGNLTLGKNLPNGVYVVKIESNGEVVVKKVLIQ